MKLLHDSGYSFSSRSTGHCFIGLLVYENGCKEEYMSHWAHGLPHADGPGCCDGAGDSGLMGTSYGWLLGRDSIAKGP